MLPIAKYLGRNFRAYEKKFDGLKCVGIMFTGVNYGTFKHLP